MNTKSQCHAIVATFGKRWFTNTIVFAHLGITSLHRRLSDLEKQGYTIERKWHPERTHKVYRVAGKMGVVR